MVTPTKTDIGLREEMAELAWNNFITYLEEHRLYITENKAAPNPNWKELKRRFPKGRGVETAYEIADQILQTCTEKLTERFNEWTDERIIDCSITPQSKNHRIILETQRDTLNWAKINLARIVREIQDE